MGMLVSGRGDTSIYLPVLTGVTATWLPNPKAPPSLNVAEMISSALNRGQTPIDQTDKNTNTNTNTNTKQIQLRYST